MSAQCIDSDIHLWRVQIRDLDPASPIAADMKRVQELQKKQIEMKKTEAEYKRDSGSLGKFEKAEAEMQAKLGQLNYVEGTLEKLEAELRPKQHQVNGLRQSVDGGEARFGNLRFDYRDPEKNFDRRRVLGVAAKLFQVRDDHNIDFCTALEEVAGGKLYNVVVDTAVTGQALLSRGNLGRRTTFMPLNKMNSRDNASPRLAAARQVGGQDNVWAPLELIDYDRAIEPAVLHLFGSALICRDLNIANKVAFNKNVMMNRSEEHTSELQSP